MRSKYLSTEASQETTLVYPPQVRISLIDLHTYQNECWLGSFDGDAMLLSDWGHIVAEEWLRAAARRQDFTLDTWSIQPNSIRGIVLLPQTSALSGALTMAGTAQGEKPWALSSFIASFKAAAAKRINLLRNQPGLPVWQRGYHEQVIANAETLVLMRQHLGLKQR